VSSPSESQVLSPPMESPTLSPSESGTLTPSADRPVLGRTALVGIAVAGGVVALGTISLVVVFCVCRQRRSKFKILPGVSSSNGINNPLRSDSAMQLM
jgi:hypothetical protein